MDLSLVKSLTFLSLGGGLRPPHFVTVDYTPLVDRELPESDAEPAFGFHERARVQATLDGVCEGDPEPFVPNGLAATCSAVVPPCETGSYGAQLVHATSLHRFSPAPGGGQTQPVSG